MSDSEMSGGEAAGGDNYKDEEDTKDVKPQNPEELLKAKKRARTQKRLSTMRNKVLRNAQWATLKKEKQKVNRLIFNLMIMSFLHFFLIS